MKSSTLVAALIALVCAASARAGWEEDIKGIQIAAAETQKQSDAAKSKGLLAQLDAMGFRPGGYPKTVGKFVCADSGVFDSDCMSYYWVWINYEEKGVIKMQLTVAHYDARERKDDDVTDRQALAKVTEYLTAGGEILQEYRKNRMGESSYHARRCAERHGRWSEFDGICLSSVRNRPSDSSTRSSRFDY